MTIHTSPGPSAHCVFKLRDYQEQAVRAVYESFKEGRGNPVVELPTGAGKSYVIAQLAVDAVLKHHGRAIILAHRMELLEQNADKIRLLCPGLKIGIYSAGLNSRDTDADILVAGIQSVYRRGEELGHFDLCIVDEAHLIPSHEDSMYRRFFAENAPERIVGLTATPFRTGEGTICEKGGILNFICYKAEIGDLIKQGFLCPLVTKASRQQIDFSHLHIRAGEFVETEVEQLMNRDDLVSEACTEILKLTRDRNRVLVFTSGVKHGESVTRTLSQYAECGFIIGETPTEERSELIARFRDNQTPPDSRPLKYLVNVNVLTTGFDAPNIDCIAILRPTMSPGLWYQMVGRGFRVHPGKENCLVLDFGGNALRHGPVDDLQMPRARGSKNGQVPVKVCPQCQLVLPAGTLTCPECGYGFINRGFEFQNSHKVKHDVHASSIPVLSMQCAGPQKYQVLAVRYSEHIKRNAPLDAPRTLKVEYLTDEAGWIPEWVAIEHPSKARYYAKKWWQQRSRHPIPTIVQDAVAIATAGGLAKPRTIVVQWLPGKRWPEIKGYELEPIPPLLTDEEIYHDKVPF